MDKIIQMNFSGVCGRQNCFEKIYEADLTAVQGTNGYCSDEAAEKIRAAIASFSAEGIHFLDSGNYHYASLFWLEKIRKPYDLLVFDHHTDMQPSAWGDELLSCGSWIRTAVLRDQEKNGPEGLQRIWIAGPEKEKFEEALSQPELAVFSDRIRLLSKEDLSPVANENEDRPLYISIDKDILSKEEVDTNWDQGDWSLDELFSSLKAVCAARNVIGIDICGEPDAQAYDAAVHRSAEVNQALIAALSGLFTFA